MYIQSGLGNAENAAINPIYLYSMWETNAQWRSVVESASHGRYPPQVSLQRREGSGRRQTVRATVKPGAYQGPPVTPGGSEMHKEHALWFPALLMSENFNYLVLSQHKPID